MVKYFRILCDGQIATELKRKLCGMAIRSVLLYGIELEVNKQYIKNERNRNQDA